MNVALYFGDRCIIAQSEGALKASHVAFAEIVDRTSGDLGIGHCDDGVCEGSDACGAKSDFFDDTLNGTIDDDPVSNLEGLIDKGDDGAEEMGIGFAFPTQTIELENKTPT